MAAKPRIRVVAAEIERDGRFLITQRPPRAVLPLLWEFPGGRVEAGETDADALRREIRKLVGVEVEVDTCTLEVAHEYQRYHLDLAVYRARVAGGEPRPAGAHDLRWVAPDEFADYEFPPADQQSVDALLSEE